MSQRYHANICIIILEINQTNHCVAVIIYILKKAKRCTLKRYKIKNISYQGLDSLFVPLIIRDNIQVLVLPDAHRSICHVVSVSVGPT